MSSEKSIIVVVTVVCMAALVVARAAPTTQRTITLSDAVNRTTCPIKVTIDEDPKRIPRRIKLLTCAPDPRQWCADHHMPSHECCEHKHALSSDNKAVMQCAEIHDSVLVYYPHSGKQITYDVAVGCACMVENASALQPNT